ncbi:MAG: 2-C-methyl-D-erythritol 4-phosphate cytidylyltransferase, partial [Brevibacterium sp.]|nr:2-C-methyl-D-erythritol 4-phosphate cytidylyltransferase [Brevibacterium sp.]
MVPAAGSGSRLGSTDPKAFVRVNGKSLLVRSLETIISSGVASTIVVAAPEEFLTQARSEIDSISRSARRGSSSGDWGIQITAVAGGNDRIESVQSALQHAGVADIVLVHDAARALTPPVVFRRVVAAVRAGAEAVVPVLPMTDTVRRAENRPAQNHTRTEPAAPQPRTQANAPRTHANESRDEPRTHANESRDEPRTRANESRTGANGRQVLVDSDAEIDQNLPTVEVLHGDLDRSSLRRVQTPQGFTAPTLRRAHERYTTDLAAMGPGVVAATDDAGLVE